MRYELDFNSEQRSVVLLTANRPWLAEQATTKRNVIDTWAYVLVPTGDNDTCAECVFVLVAELLEQISSNLNSRCPCCLSMTRFSMRSVLEF
jgi:hypothetical protein